MNNKKAKRNLSLKDPSIKALNIFKSNLTKLLDGEEPTRDEQILFLTEGFMNPIINLKSYLGEVRKVLKENE